VLQLPRVNIIEIATDEDFDTEI